MNEIKNKFKELFKKEIIPRVYKRNKLISEIDKLYSERYKLISEIDKINSERYKLNSEIFNILDNFEKENNCIIECECFDFKLENIEIKLK